MTSPFSDRFPGYQRMTQLPRELEEGLLHRSRSALCIFLRTKSMIVETDTRYTAVHWIAKEFTEAQIEKFLSVTEPAPDLVPEAPRVVSSIPAGTKPGDPPRTPKAEKPAKDTSKVHPQQVINAKVAIAKAANGAIGYDRATRSWLVRKGTETIHWTADEFREMTLEQVKAYFA